MSQNKTTTIVISPEIAQKILNIKVNYNYNNPQASAEQMRILANEIAKNENEKELLNALMPVFVSDNFRLQRVLQDGSFSTPESEFLVFKIDETKKTQYAPIIEKYEMHNVIDVFITHAKQNNQIFNNTYGSISKLEAIDDKKLQEYANIAFKKIKKNHTYKNHTDWQKVREALLKNTTFMDLVKHYVQKVLEMSPFYESTITTYEAKKTWQKFAESYAATQQLPFSKSPA